MSFNLNQFKSQLTYGGARANLFEVSLSFPTYVGLGSSAGAKSRFMVKGAPLPGSNIAPIEVQYFGRVVKVAGNRTFDEISFTIINDEDFVIRDAMEQWMNGINGHINNVQTSGTNVSSYTADLTINQYGKEGGSPIKSYTLVGAFPTTVDEIELNWGTNDEIEEYGVTFNYQWWQSNTNL